MANTPAIPGSLQDLMLLLQSNNEFLKAMLPADQSGGTSPAPVAVPVEIKEGKPVSELSFVNLVLFVCFEKTPNQVRISSSCWDFKKCSVSSDLPRKTKKNWLVLLLVLLFLYLKKKA